LVQSALLKEVMGAVVYAIITYNRQGADMSHTKQIIFILRFFLISIQIRSGRQRVIAMRRRYGKIERRRYCRADLQRF
jgi:hypothetical protein